MSIVKSAENNTMYSMQEQRLFLCSFSFFTSSIFSAHYSTNLSANLFLHLKFSYSKYSPTSHDLLHSHLQLLGFQYILYRIHLLSINSLDSHQHLSPSQRCLVLQVLASNLHLHLHVSCHFMCLVSLALEIRLNTSNI